MANQILVVDDYDAFRSLISEILSPLGLDIVEASNGKEAADLLKSGLRPTLILSDVQMPIMDGFAFLDAVSQERCNSGIPVVLASGLPELESRAIQSGAVSFINKMELDEKLLPLVESILETQVRKKAIGALN